MHWKKVFGWNITCCGRFASPSLFLLVKTTQWQISLQYLQQPCAWEHQKHFLKESHSQLTCPPSQLLCRTEHLKRIYVLDVQYWSVKTWTFLLEAASKMRKPRVRFRCLWSSLKFVPCWISSMVLYRYLVSMTSTCRTCWKTLFLLGSLK